MTDLVPRLAANSTGLHPTAVRGSQIVARVREDHGACRPIDPDKPGPARPNPYEMVFRRTREQCSTVLRINSGFTAKGRTQRSAQRQGCRLWSSSFEPAPTLQRPRGLADVHPDDIESPHLRRTPGAVRNRNDLPGPSGRAPERRRTSVANPESGWRTFEWR